MNSLDTELDTWSRKYQAGLRAARLRDEAITFEVLILIHHGGGNRYSWDTYQNTAPLAIGGKLKVTES